MISRSYQTMRLWYLKSLINVAIRETKYNAFTLKFDFCYTDFRYFEKWKSLSFLEVQKDFRRYIFSFEFQKWKFSQIIFVLTCVQWFCFQMHGGYVCKIDFESNAYLTQNKGNSKLVSSCIVMSDYPRDQLR